MKILGWAIIALLLGVLIYSSYYPMPVFNKQPVGTADERHEAYLREAPLWRYFTDDPCWIYNPSRERIWVCVQYQDPAKDVRKDETAPPSTVTRPIIPGPPPEEELHRRPN